MVPPGQSHEVTRGWHSKATCDAAQNLESIAFVMLSMTMLSSVIQFTYLASAGGPTGTIGLRCNKTLHLPVSTSIQRRIHRPFPIPEATQWEYRRIVVVRTREPNSRATLRIRPILPELEMFLRVIDTSLDHSGNPAVH